MSVSVFRMRKDLRFRSYGFDCNAIDEQSLMAREHPARMKRESISDWWTPVPCFPQDPMTAAGDFFTAGTIGLFGVSDRVFDDENARKLLQEAGELLPLVVSEESRTVFFYRITSKGLRHEVLDNERSITENYFELQLVFFRIDSGAVDASIFPGKSTFLPYTTLRCLRIETFFSGIISRDIQGLNLSKCGGRICDGAAR